VSNQIGSLVACRHGPLSPAGVKLKREVTLQHRIESSKEEEESKHRQPVSDEFHILVQEMTLCTPRAFF
jgi:hypothetical protein